MLSRTCSPTFERLWLTEVPTCEFARVMKVGDRTAGLTEMHGVNRRFELRCRQCLVPSCAIRLVTPVIFHEWLVNRPVENKACWAAGT